MTQNKTPGVYVQEASAFPNSVVEVPTSVPAFIGYTEKAPSLGTPTRIMSLSEFTTLFGGAPHRIFKRTDPEESIHYATAAQDFYLFNALRIYFNNGGGPCWVTSVGTYDDEDYSSDDFTETMWADLAKVSEPSMYVIPDAVALPANSYKNICEAAIFQCQTLMDRVVILDVYDGKNGRIYKAIDGNEGFRNALSFGDKPSFATAYYPWLNTSINDMSEIDYRNLDKASRAVLASEITAEKADLQDEADKIKKSLPNEEARRTHNVLMAQSRHYNVTMTGLAKAMNVLPPSGAMAGVYARTDANFGVFKAPANTGIMSVVSPTIAISDYEQEGLNVPLDGYAVNAIRSFLGRGVLVWGARTLDGNSEDYRYINVRRTLIMLEQSIQYATQAYMFESNTSDTWVTVKNMISNFLTNQWNAGALAGATPSDAFSVDVGLGTTMSSHDVLDGYMRVVVKVAMTHPAEFIVITYQQKMQTS